MKADIILKTFLLSFAATLFLSCQSKHQSNNTKEEVIEEDNSMFVDKHLTKETKELYNKLAKISEKGVAFGHQDATSYGIGWKHNGFPSDSDVKKITGDYPAVFGFEIGQIEWGKPVSLDSVPFDLMKRLIKEAYQNGSIITISWHADNPETNGNSWDNTPAVSKILKGGELRDKFEKYMQNTAEFLLDLKDDNGNLIPVLFRPWHEMTGDWFWWGGKNRTTEEYKMLFKETVELLRDKYSVHNLLYVYSPDKIYHNKEYLENYPGDDWVDIFGIDIYDPGENQYVPMVTNSLELIKYIAASKNKLFAFTETGKETIPVDNWWTNQLYEAVKGSGAVYVLVWRNARKDHHYAPYPGHNSEKDFKEFVNKEDILLQNDIK
ncbi:glycoside hydrolase family 26 protein [Abyssalbus ytuae]|uniref:Mannan endo-1,4-beta-mannosidase n=1 Tax=Abyssalbus ytuae TaxID=2926907 RepID=A0A9E6ZMY0_9FLAO|nr:glycosyl hydrolase [Abyssalbus ytuae]UOB18812.1 glycoside hydrolase family 26 protein [Abyssalbus ytuae]